MSYLEIFKRKIINIPTDGIQISIKGGEFTATPVFTNGMLSGIEVSNLGNQPFLPLDVFVVVLTLLEVSEGNQARKGNAMNARLGDAELRVDTVEGIVAKVVYGKNIGETVFRRITPISRILEWAGICQNRNGFLILNP